MLRALLLALAAARAWGRACAGGEGSRITIDGVPGASYLAGAGGETLAGRLVLVHNAGVSITTACSEEWRPEEFKLFQLLGKTLSFTIDLSHVGCACNVAIYLIYAPPRDANGQLSVGECAGSPFYCDANQVCGSFCPELDIMEANNRVFQTTPHSCSAPSPMGHYSSCDRAGCFLNTRDLDSRLYGPGAHYRIDTRYPFEVHTTFHGSVTLDGDSSFTGLTTRLVQGRRSVILDHSSCRGYLEDLARPLANGMSMRITYWGNGAANMSWMDQPPCGDENCSGRNAGHAIVSDMRVTEPAKIHFPLSFEDLATGACPKEWTCTGEAQVCDIWMNSPACNNTGLRGTGGAKYLSLGSGQGTGTATSPVFLLPDGIDRIALRRGGGAGVGSGIYVRRRNDSQTLCFSENGTGAAALLPDVCDGLAGHQGEAVYLELRDAQRSAWGRVVVDEVWLLDRSGANLSTGEALWEHAGENCLPHCGKAGFCEWCGSGGACCHNGWTAEPAECQGAQHTVAGHHECVLPASQEVTLHSGEDCWSYCGGAGYCAWCGSGNACCRSGWDTPEECVGVTHSTEGHHECVVPVSRHVAFPVSFERAAAGTCPEGWSCAGAAAVCSAEAGGLCGHLDMAGGEAVSQLLAVGGGRGTASSPIFVLPSDIRKVRFKRGGRAGRGSGFYIHRKWDGRVLCSAVRDNRTARFAESECGGLEGHGGEEVYIHVRDADPSSAGGVFIDDIRLISTSGAVLRTDRAPHAAAAAAAGRPEEAASRAAEGDTAKRAKMAWLGVGIGAVCAACASSVWCQAFAKIRGAAAHDYARLLTPESRPEQAAAAERRTGEVLGSGGTLVAL